MPAPDETLRYVWQVDWGDGDWCDFGPAVRDYARVLDSEPVRRPHRLVRRYERDEPIDQMTFGVPCTNGGES
jgi:hypothetical protein